MVKNIVIQIEPAKINITPYGFHKYASDYFDAGERWPKTDEISPYSPVPYFLYCRAMELGLKSFLLAKGKKLKWIKKKLGHSLDKGLRIAKSNGLDDLFKTTNEEINEISKANRNYQIKGFEYFFVSNHVTGLKDIPDLKILRQYSQKLLSKIRELVQNTDLD